MKETQNLYFGRTRSSSKRKLHVGCQPNTSLSTSSSSKSVKLSDHPLRSSSSTSSATSNATAPSISQSSSNSEPNQLQFFVRTISKTLVLRASPDDLVLSVHGEISRRTRIPVNEQRLLYSGKQLEREKTLRESAIENDAGLQLVGRMRSTACGMTWGVVDGMVSAALSLCKGECEDSHVTELSSNISEFLVLINQTSWEEKGHECLERKSHGNCRFYEIFNDAGVARALVLLFLSPISGNKECAVNSIRSLISPSVDCLSDWARFNCIPIVIELCKLLRGNDPEDSLYSACRRTLGSLLNITGFEYVNKARCFEFAKSRIMIRDLFPFVRELAKEMIANLEFSLSAGLCKYKEGTLAENVHDFVAFIRPVCMIIKGHVGAVGKFATDPKRPCYMEEVISMHDMSLELLKKINRVLVQVENSVISLGAVWKSESLPVDWDQYIHILKELNSLGKIYKNVKDVLHSIMQDRRLSIDYLIKHIKKNGESYDHEWLLEFKDVMDFESRRHLVMMMFPNVEYNYGEVHEMLIGRSSLLEDSYAYVTGASYGSFRNGLLVEFKNEEATGAGVLREWFYLVCQAIVDPQRPLFLACPVDHKRFFPNPASKVDPKHLDYFRFCGRVIALALMNKVHVGIVFDRVFFKLLAGKSVSLEDVRDADPCLYMSCKKILEMDAEFVDSDSLGLTFVREIEELGFRTIEELKHGGKNIVVNSENREEYVNLLIQHNFVTSISDQVDYFARGFSDVLANPNHHKLFFQSLEHEDLDRMLQGNDNAINVKEWKAHTDYNGYRETDPQICWFWKVIERMPTEQQRSLLFFWTSVKYLPVSGFSGLSSRLQICRISGARNRLPSSQTCFYRLCLPPYPSLAAMRKSLHFITQEHVSQSFGEL